MSHTAAGGPADAALNGYVYNMALAAAYLGPLHLVEIAVRNAMHAQLSGWLGRTDWWESDELRLVPRQDENLRNKISLLRRDRARRNLADPTSDDVVASLDFGFWTGLLKSGDRRAGIDYERTLWQQALRHAFPGFRGDRNHLHNLMNQTRNIRNRVGHHEPIHLSDHARNYQRMIALLSYVSSDVAEWCHDRSRLPTVSQAGPDSRAPATHF